MRDVQPKALRLHIAIFGRRNVGKSSLLNALTKQAVSVVSNVAGTTTDCVEKTMEFHELGPVVWIDTPGFDDVGQLGGLRVEKTQNALNRCDLAMFVFSDRLTFEDQQFIDVLKTRKIPFLIIKNKCETPEGDDGLSVSAKTGRNLDVLCQKIVALLSQKQLELTDVLAPLFPSCAMIILVTPIDDAAPKGRMIIPQVQTLRALIDLGHIVTFCTPTNYEQALANLNGKVDGVICDSQAFFEVEKITPSAIILTSFSILFAKLKGDFDLFYRGAQSLDQLCENDKVLIVEACTHHAVGDDIGRVKIPALLRKKVGGSLDIHVVSGADFPKDLSIYKLVIHCGACTLTRQMMLNRVHACEEAKVAMTNYGLAISGCLGILKRASEVFLCK